MVPSERRERERIAIFFALVLQHTSKSTVARHGQQKIGAIKAKAGPHSVFFSFLLPYTPVDGKILFQLRLVNWFLLTVYAYI